MEKVKKWHIPSETTFEFAPDAIFDRAIPEIIKYHPELISKKLKAKSKFSSIRNSRRTDSLRLYDVIFVIADKFTDYGISEDIIGRYYDSFNKNNRKTSSTSITTIIASVYFLLKKNRAKYGLVDYDNLEYHPVSNLNELVSDLGQYSNDSITGSYWLLYYVRRVVFHKKRIKGVSKKEYAIVESLLHFPTGTTVNYEGLNRRLSGNWRYTPNSTIIQITIEEKDNESSTPVHRFITLMCFDKSNTVLEGAMITSNSSGVIYQNRILAERIDSNKKPPKELSKIKFYSDRFLSDEFTAKRRYFLSEFDTKYSRTIGEVKDESSLLERLNTEQNFNYPTKYSYYFPSPVSSLSKKEHNFTQQLIKKLVDFFQNEIEYNNPKPFLYSIGLNDDLNVINQHDLEYIASNQYKYEQCKNSIKLTDHIIWVNLFNVTSTSAMQADWLFYPNVNNKPSVFIYSSNVKLPGLLLNDKFLGDNKIKLIEIKKEALGDLGEMSVNRVFAKIKTYKEEITTLLSGNT